MMTGEFDMDMGRVEVVCGGVVAAKLCDLSRWDEEKEDEETEESWRGYECGEFAGADAAG